MHTDRTRTEPNNMTTITAAITTAGTTIRAMATEGELHRNNKDL